MASRFPLASIRATKKHAAVRTLPPIKAAGEAEVIGDRPGPARIVRS
jgi:hypothetical protein